MSRTSGPVRSSWPAARRTAQTAAAALEPVQVGLSDGLDATLAAPLHAAAALPAYDSAAMDGYAIAGPGPWTVCGHVLAGDTAPGRTLQPGDAVEVSTGAQVPPGADAVLPYEQAGLDGQVLTGLIEPGRHIRRRGEVCGQGDLLLEAGTRLTPAALGLAAGVGHDSLVVHRRPRVGLVVTGDEVVAAGPPGPGRVRDAIGPLLPGVVRWAGGRTDEDLHLRDDARSLDQALGAAEDDVVVVCGSSAAGMADHLRAALTALGAELLVSGVACRPGHPQLLAKMPAGPWVVGLPGNPYAALVASLTLLAPLLGTLAGRAIPAPIWATTAGRVSAHPTDTCIVAARRTGAAVAPVGHDGPASLWGAAFADVLAVIPPGWSGGPVELLALPGSSADR